MPMRLKRIPLPKSHDGVPSTALWAMECRSASLSEMYRHGQFCCTWRLTPQTLNPGGGPPAKSSCLDVRMWWHDGTKNDIDEYQWISLHTDTWYADDHAMTMYPPCFDSTLLSSSMCFGSSWCLASWDDAQNCREIDTEDPKEAGFEVRDSFTVWFYVLHVRCKPHVCPHRIPHISWHAQIHA